MLASPTASIVINTFNRARSLERLLPSLQRLCGTFEVVVVNGPSTDDTAQVLARHGGTLKVVSCPTANLSRSRNLGIAAAAGDIVVFIDDDALPGDPEWLSKLVAVFAGPQAGHVGAAGGPSLHRDSDWPEFAGGWTSDYAEQRFTDDVPARGRWYRRTVGNNSAFRRTALVAIGGFDERFRYYLDEADVCLRLHRAGFETVYVPDAPVRHYPATSPIGRPFIRNRRIIALSDTYYCLKNGGDRWLSRLWTTLRLAPRKHFVTEVPGLVAQGRLTPAEAAQIRREWRRGVFQGVVLALCARRALRLSTEAPPPFLPFPTSDSTRALSVALSARRLPPDPHAGGVGRYTWDLAVGLFERGHNVTLMTESETPVARIGLGFEVVGIRPAGTAPGLSQLPVLASNVRYAEAVARVVQARQAGPSPFSVVHATTWGLEGVGVAAGGLCPVSMMLVTPLESVMAAEQWTPSPDLLANICLDQIAIDAAARVCAPSARVIATYAARPHWSGSAVCAVPLGTLATTPPAGLPRDTRRRLLFVGRHERRKGIHVLLEVLPELLSRHRAWTCELVGSQPASDGGGLTFAQQFLDRHRGAEWLSRVEFSGAIADTELPARYARADVFVAPSLFESFGLVYLEAMQHGVPVVGTSVGGVPDVVDDGVNGLLVPPGDADALAVALDRVMGDDALRHRLGRAGAASMAGRTHLAMADRMVEQYRAAVASFAGTPHARAWDGVEPLADCAVRLLEARGGMRGLALACRAASAYEAGATGDASRLIAEALGVDGRPDYYPMAIELALAEDPARAVALAERGFSLLRDESEACLVCAATLLTRANRAWVPPAEWQVWLTATGSRLAERVLAAAVGAIRASRDLTAVTLLEACRERASEQPHVRAAATYHLASALKRLGRTEESRVFFDTVLGTDSVSLLDPAVRAAAYFHAGELALLAGDSDHAVRHLSACVAMAPGHTRAGVCLDDARRRRTALAA